LPKSCNEKGTWFILCEAPFGPFRQNKPGPFFVAEHIQHDNRKTSVANRGKSAQAGPVERFVRILRRCENGAGDRRARRPGRERQKTEFPRPKSNEASDEAHTA